jgi:hypothetical protein
MGGKNVNIHDFLSRVEQQSINTQFINKLTETYGTKFIEYVEKLLSVSSDGIFFENDDILRLLSHKEILNACEELSVNFIELQLIPVFDTGDNDYIVFDIENKNWCKFNIVDSVKFKQKSLLSEFFEKQ